MTDTVDRIACRAKRIGALDMLMAIVLDPGLVKRLDSIHVLDGERLKSELDRIVHNPEGWEK